MVVQVGFCSGKESRGAGAQAPTLSITGVVFPRLYREVIQYPVCVCVCHTMPGANNMTQLHTISIRLTLTVHNKQYS